MTTIPTDTEGANEPSLLDLLARVKAVLDECEANPEKIKHYFGYFETSEGDL